MKKIQFILAALCVAAIISGCGKSDGSAPAAGKKLKLAFVANNAATFWTIARTGCDAAAIQF